MKRREYRAEFALLQAGFVPDFSEKEGAAGPACTSLLTEMPLTCCGERPVYPLGRGVLVAD